MPYSNSMCDQRIQNVRTNMRQHIRTHWKNLLSKFDCMNKDGDFMVGHFLTPAPYEPDFTSEYSLWTIVIIKDNNTKTIFFEFSSNDDGVYIDKCCKDGYLLNKDNVLLDEDNNSSKYEFPFLCLPRVPTGELKYTIINWNDGRMCKNIALSEFKSDVISSLE